MTAAKACAASCLVVAIVIAGACKGGRGEGELHAQVAMKQREADGLRASLSRLERGEPILPEDAVVVSVSQSVVTQLLNVQLPFEASAGSLKVTLTKGEAVFKGSPAVTLTGLIAPSGEPALAGEIAVFGALEGIKIDPESGTLRANIAVDHVDLLKMAGLEKLVGGGSLDELGQLVRKQMQGSLPEVQIPVRIEQSIDLPAVSDGPVRIEGARMPLEAAVADVFAAEGSLWVAVRVTPGEFVKTGAPAEAGGPAAPRRAGNPR